MWARRFILFHKRHPSSIGSDEVNAFLSSLAIDDRVSASTQNQALNALLYLYRHVLQDPLPWLQDVVRARRPMHLPVVLTPEEVRLVIDRMNGVARRRGRLGRFQLHGVTPAAARSLRISRQSRRLPCRGEASMWGGLQLRVIALGGLETV